jgi:DNA-binding CsgD family transcriptional regulator
MDEIWPDRNLWSCCCDLEHLTDREIEVLCLVATGRTNKQVANLLNISEHTVHRHVTAMLRRLGEISRTGLVSRTYRAGILVMGEHGPSWSGRRCLQIGAAPQAGATLTLTEPPSPTG